MRLPLLPNADTEGALNVLQMGTYFASVNSLPRMNSSRRKNGEAEELKQFAKLAGRLRAQINKMHREALNTLSPKNSRHVLAVDCDLEDMIGRAERRIEAACDENPSTSPKRVAPEQIAQICAQLYVDLTGKRAVPHGNEYSGRKGGPFIRFVEEVYTALAVKGSAEHYGRSAETAKVIGGGGGVTMRKTRRKGA